MKKIFSVALSIFILMYWLFWCGLLYAADIEAVLDENAGVSAFSVKDSGSVEGAHIDSDGNMVIKGGLRLDASGVEYTTPEGLIVDGNVGIGTTSPSQELHVAGDIKLDGFIYDVNNQAGTNGQLLSKTASGVDWVDAPSGADNLGNHIATQNIQLSGYWLSNDGGNEGVFVDTAGNVGIGTTNPGALLTVGNDLFQVNSSGNLVKVNNITYSWPSSQGSASTYLRNDGSGNLSWTTASSAGGWTDGGTDVYVTTPTDNVGLGTTAPSAKLDIKANGSGTGKVLRIQDSSGIDRVTILDSGYVGIGTTNPTVRLTVISSGQPTIIAEDNNGYTQIMARRTIASGEATFIAYPDVAPSVTDPFWAMGLSYDGSKGWSLDRGFGAGRSTAIRVDLSDNVGIGTTSPAEKLEVGGNIKLSGASATYKVTNVATPTAASDVATKGYVDGLTSGGGWTDNLTNVYLTTTSDSVGIGTTAPSVKLHVVGDGSYAGAFMSGNVGIGITSPGYKLDVAGTFSADSVNVNSAYTLPTADGTSGYVLKTNGSGTVSWSADTSGTAGGSDGQVQYNDGGSFGGASALYYDDTNSRVGIGTTGPVHNLHVDDSDDSVSLNVGEDIGSTVDTTAYRIASWNNNNVYIDTKLGSTGKIIYRYGEGAQSGASNTWMTIEDGNVGIGTTSPGYKLDVAGTFSADSVNINSAYTLPTADGSAGYVLSTNGSGTVSWTSVAGGDITAVGSMTSGAAFADATADDDWLGLGASAGRIEFDDQATDEVNILSANVGIGTTGPQSKLDFGTSAANQKLVIGTYTFGNFWSGIGMDSADAGIRIAGDPTSATSRIADFGYYSNDASHTWTNLVRIQQNGNVGIGTTSPQRKLHISDASSAYVHMTTPTSGETMNDGLTLGLTTTTGILRMREALPLSLGTDDSDDLTIISGGNVGIGTTGPSGKLHVEMTSGRMYTGGDNLTLQYTASTTKFPYIQWLNSAGTRGAYMGWGSPGSYLELTMENSNNFAITGGNVGIGTTGPVARLTIWDNTTDESQMIRLGATSASDYKIYRERTTGTLIIQGTQDGYNNFSYKDDAGNVLLRILENGNVGIGTTSPGAKLDVTNTGANTYVRITGDVAQQQALEFRDTAQRWVIYKPASGTDLRFWDGGADRVTILNGGNVGIGTTSPGYKLDVAGTFSADSVNINSAYTLPTADGTSGYVLSTNGSGTVSWTSVAGGDITAVGSMTSGAAFADATADDDWLGLGASAGRIEFDDQATDEVNILDANVGIGTTAPTVELDVAGSIRAFNKPSMANWDNVTIWADGTKGYIQGNGDDSGMWIKSNVESVHVDDTLLVTGNVGIGTTSPGTKLAVSGLTGTASYNLVRVDTATGNFYYDSSSKRYKDNIQPLADDFSKILKVQAETFRDKSSGEQEIGYIAEELDAAGLKNLVVYNAKGQADGIKYDKVAIYLLEVVKQQQEEIMKLKAAITK